jgi:hypothetical protein
LSSDLKREDGVEGVPAILENLAGKARKLGIPVWRFGSGGAKAPPFGQLHIQQ